MPACRRWVLYWWRTLASSARRTAGSRIWSRCGQSALMWLNRLSIQAWSGGVPGRPKCWAIAHMARNSRVEPEVICGPLSLTANSTGPGRVIDGRVGQPRVVGVDVVEQAFELERVREGELDLQAGLLAGDDLGDPLARDEVHDHRRVRVAAAREAGRVVDPDRVLGVGRPRRERLALRAPGPPRHLDPELMLGQHAADRGLRDPHDALVGAAVRELAMRPVTVLIGLEHGRIAASSAGVMACTGCPPGW